MSNGEEVRRLIKALREARLNGYRDMQPGEIEKLSSETEAVLKVGIEALKETK